MRKILIILMSVLMLAVLCGAGSTESGGLGIEAGQTMPDFTVALTDGSEATLSELLKENDLVVLNICTSWCAPCESEFPVMDQVYQDNIDRMVILAVSGDPEDTMEMMADYKASHGLSFPMGLAGNALDFVKYSAFPTTIFIDKQGQIGFIKVGAFGEDDEFETKVNYFLSEEYSGEPLTSEIAHSYILQILGGVLVMGLLDIIGKWRILHKAGKPGWHSLIPILNNYQEYAICWKGWIGLLNTACLVGIPVLNVMVNSGQIDDMVYFIIRLLLFAGILSTGLAESLKLAKAFGKKTLAGILLWFTGGLGRIVLSFTKPGYQRIDG